MDEGKLPNLKKLADERDLSDVGFYTALGVANRVVELRDGRQSRQAQYLRLSGPRLPDVRA
jgi:hypothetical protein